MKERGLSKSLVPEVEIPSIDELVLSEVEGGQVHQHGGRPPKHFRTLSFIYQQHKCSIFPMVTVSYLLTTILSRKGLYRLRALMLIFLSRARFGPQFEDGMKRKRKAEKKMSRPQKGGV